MISNHTLLMVRNRKSELSLCSIEMIEKIYQAEMSKYDTLVENSEHVSLKKSIRCSGEVIYEYSNKNVSLTSSCCTLLCPRLVNRFFLYILKAFVN